MKRFVLYVCMISIFSVSMAASATAATKDKNKKTTTKKPCVVCLTLSGSYDEGPTKDGPFGESSRTLAGLIQRLDAAAADKDVLAVWLKIDSLSAGAGKTNELRAAVARIRKANKPVYAELSSADSGEYLLATACDQIVMPPSGTLVIPGVRMEITFYKGLLDKLGLQFDVLKMGKYKGAAEPYTRTDISKDLRESYEAMADDRFAAMIETIAADRKLKDYQVKTHIDRGLFKAEDAQKAGLIDEVLYSDQLLDNLKKRFNDDKLEIVTNYLKKKVDMDFSGVSGMMKLIEIFMGVKPSESASKNPKIALVYAVGPITQGKSTSSLFGESSIGSTSMIAALRKADEDPKVVAIVLRIDSPGGSAIASDLIWRETVRIKKPIIASMGNVAGSGGYYIAMGAKKIYAAPGTLTGSIGVIGGKLVTKGLYDKLGLNTEVISRGANSGSMSSNSPFTTEEKKVWTENIEDTYKQFVSKAAEGRKMTFSKLESMAQGRVYTGKMAKQLGLIDELGTMQDAIAAAKAEAGLKPDAEVEFLNLPEQKSFFEQLFDDESEESSDAKMLLPEWIQTLQQARVLRQLLSERMLMWMPYTVNIE